MKKRMVATMIAAMMVAAIPATMAGAEETKVVKIALQGEITWQQEIFDQFEAETGYTVEPILIPSDQDMYTKTMLLMESADTCPDVIAEDGFMVKSDAAAGKLYCLDDVIKEWEDISNFDPAMLEGGKGVDGKTYAVMCSTDTQILFYNKELLAEIGIEGEWQPSNWQEIIDVALKLKEENADVEDFIPMWMFASSTYPEETSMRTFQMLLSGTEGEWPSQLYDETEGKWVVDKEKLLTTFNFINDVFNIHKIGETPAQAADSSMGNLLVSDYMQTGKIGLFMTGSWTLGQFATQYPYEEAMDVWGCANMPTSEGQEPKYTTMSGGWTWASPELANDKEGAVELLKYLCSYEGVLARVMYNGEASPRTDVAEAEEYLSQTPSAIPFTSGQLEFAHFRPSVDGYSSITTSFTAAVESVATGAETPEQAIDTLQNEMIRQFGEENVIVK